MIAILLVYAATSWLGGGVFPRGRPSAEGPVVTGSLPGGADPAKIAAGVEPATVDITSTLTGGLGIAAGTGVVLSSSGEVLTNNHVIAGADTISVQVGGAGPTRAATLVGADVPDDVALLQVQDASGLTAAPLGDSAAVSVGDPVVAVGNALGRGGPPAVSAGRVTALGQTITAGDQNGFAETLNGMIQVDAQIQQGDSGGPLVDLQGKVVGITTAAEASGRRVPPGFVSHVGYAIPINRAGSLVKVIESQRRAAAAGPAAVLGVQVTDADPSSGSPVLGARVIAVGAGSPAAAAGLTTGDVIVQLGDTPVGSAAALRAAELPYRPGDRVAVTWVDGGGASRTARLTLGAAPAG